MDALIFIEERQRMCKSYYDAEKGHCSDECPAHDVQCIDLDDLSTDAEELVTRVEAWSSAHPRKTRQSVFLKQYPEAKLDGGDCLELCPCAISASHRDEYGRCAVVDTKCFVCRREFWGKEVE